jgi:hypothetical protein
MATMIAEVYDALKEAGASEEKARAAATALASYENRFARLESQLVELQRRVSLLTWMVGFNLAISVTVLFRLFV